MIIPLSHCIILKIVGFIDVFYFKFQISTTGIDSSTEEDERKITQT